MRRFPGIGGYTPEQARELAALSFGLGRQLGLLIDRKGRVDMVIVGEPGGIYIPELARSRLGAARLRGLRLLHTHLRGESLSDEDLTDLLFLRLDSIAALTVTDMAEPGMLHVATLLPPSAAATPYDVHKPVPWDRSQFDFEGEARALEQELSREGENLAQDGKDAADSFERDEDKAGGFARGIGGACGHGGATGDGAGQPARVQDQPQIHPGQGQAR